MNELQTKAILAGLFFGIWPLFMNRSGLSGNVSSVIFSAAVLIGVLPFALYSSGLSIPTANWTMVTFAGIFGALGLISFNGMLANASLQNVGILFILTLVTQTTVAASYQVLMSGHLPIDKACGYVAAIAAAYLLLR
jgi:VIT1/CCC1 family predicted Fe2+/Mn2+ transporter